MDNFNKQIKKYHTLYTEGPIWNKVKNAAGAAGTRVKNAAGAAGRRPAQGSRQEPDAAFHLSAGVLPGRGFRIVAAVRHRPFRRSKQ